VTRKKVLSLIILSAIALALSGCGTIGSGVQGVGSVFNKTGGAIKNLG